MIYINLSFCIHQGAKHCFFKILNRFATLLWHNWSVFYRLFVLFYLGTNILALMVGKTDGKKIAELSKQKLHLVVKIEVQDDLRSEFVKDGEDSSIVNPPTARPAKNRTLIAPTNFLLNPFDHSVLEGLGQEDLDFLRQLGRHNGTGLNPLSDDISERYGKENLQTLLQLWKRNGTGSNSFEEVQITTTPSAGCVTYKVAWLHLLICLVCCLLLPTT